jgi:methylmalonyl-CoA mutase cobalamin-binding domain/chain
MTLAPLVVRALRERGSEVPVVVGGIVPPSDLEELRALGVAAIFRPGASAEEIVGAIQGLVAPLP